MTRPLLCSHLRWNTSALFPFGSGGRSDTWCFKRQLHLHAEGNWLLCGEGAERLALPEVTSENDYLQEGKCKVKSFVYRSSCWTDTYHMGRNITDNDKQKRKGWRCHVSWYCRLQNHCASFTSFRAPRAGWAECCRSFPVSAWPQSPSLGCGCSWEGQLQSLPSWPYYPVRGHKKNKRAHQSSLWLYCGVLHDCWFFYRQ